MYKIFTEAASLLTELRDSERLQQNIEKSVQLMTVALATNAPVLFCGNGGSAADAQHLAAELSGRFMYDRPPLNADALHCNTSYLTAVANDYSYEQIYSRLIRGRGAEGGVLVGISTSGNSDNILNAMVAAHDIGMTTIAFTGYGGGKLAVEADVLIDIPSTSTPRIQEAHIVVGHTICQLVESKIFPREKYID